MCLTSGSLEFAHTHTYGLGVVRASLKSPEWKFPSPLPETLALTSVNSMIAGVVCSNRLDRAYLAVCGQFGLGWSTAACKIMQR